LKACVKRMTKANVFIIESLSFDDEKNNRYEGKFLSQILHLGDKESMYYYIRTKKELEKVIELFEKSDYRYLHLSCHGNRTSIRTTLDRISFSELSQLIQPYLRDKRLFISACSAVNDDLAKTVIPSSKCFSIIGPAEDILFSDAAIIWASFYHLVFKEDPKRMVREDVVSTLQNVADTFGVSLYYFSIRQRSKRGYKSKLIIPKVVSQRISKPPKL
jgi:hypothetical protein